MGRAAGSRFDQKAGGPVAAGSDRLLVLHGGDVPTSATAVVGSVTVTGGTSSLDLQVYPTGHTPAVRTSNLNAQRGVTVPNAVVTALGDRGQVALSVSSGRAQVIFDVMGWFG